MVGFSSGPHLHFEIGDLYAYSVPLVFDVGGDEPVGLQSLAGVTSTTEASTSCEVTAPSECAMDAFIHRGVRVDPGMPCSVAARDTTYPFRGVANRPGGSIIVHRGTDRGWVQTCFDVNSDGRFEAELHFDAADHSGSTAYFDLSVVDRGCHAWPGFTAAVRIAFEN